MEVVIEKEKNIYNEIKKYAIKNHLLFQVEIDITSKCNADCVFCYQGQHNDAENELSRDQIFKIFDELKEMGTMHIGFAGGEPFARNDCIEILKESKKRGFRTTLVTNAHLISDDDIKWLSKIMIDHVQVSFHSVDLENYLWHFGINNKDFFYKALSNVRKMIESNIDIGIAVTVTNKNIDEAKRIVDFFTKLGINSKKIQFNLLLKGKKEIIDFYPSEEQILNNKDIVNSSEKGERGLLCSAGRISCAINSKGEVFPCTFFNTPIGNINYQSLHEIWNESHYLGILRSITEKHFEKCVNCMVNQKCHVCLVDNLNQTGNVFTPSDLYCKIRHKKYKI